MLIRRYISKDLPKMLELIRAVYDDGVYEKAVKRFKWQYEQNSNNTSEGPIILVLETEEKIIGMIGSFAMRLKIGNAVYPAYWTGDFMIHPDFRGIKNGINLAKRMFEQPFLFFGFPGEKILNLWKRIGASQVSELAKYSQETHISLIKGSNRRLKLPARCVNKVWRLMDKLKDLLSRRNPPGVKIEIVKIFDERFDQLWERASKDYKIIQVRDRAHLNWRYFECPHLSYKVLTAVKDDQLLGYVVVRHEDQGTAIEGIIVDLFVDRSDKAYISALLDAAIRTLKDTGCDVIKIKVSAYDDVLNDLLCRRTFILAEKQMGTFNNTGDALNGQICEKSNWYLMMADSDMDFS